MRKLIVFNFVTLNGFFKGPNGDISWSMHGDPEDAAYAAESLQSDGILLFGRITYEMMASYWPTREAMKNDPVVAKGMNQSEKIVFSKTLKKADWNNTKLITDNIIEETKKLKKQSAKDLAILGSGSIVTQFAEHSLVDEFQFMVNPIALSDGGTIFKGISGQLNLKLTNSRVFKNGKVLLCYQPA